MNHQDTKDTKGKRILDRPGRKRSHPSVCPVLLVSLVSWWFTVSPAHAELVYTADGMLIYGQVRAGDEAGTIVVDSGEGSPVMLRREEVSGIDFRSTPAPDAGRGASGGTAMVLLRNGDRLRGALRQLWPPTLTRGEESVVVPPVWVAGVRSKAASTAGGDARGERSAAGDSDAIELANGDRLEGHVEGVRDGRLKVRTSLGMLAIDPARVRAMVMAQGEAPPVTANGIQAVLDTTDGERITGEWLALTATEMRLKPAWRGELTVPVERLQRLTVLNGRLVFLSDLQPSEVQETNYFDSPRPYRRDRSQGGRPLRLGGRSYSRGLGVHARSVLTYALGGGYTSFAATIGIDSEVGNGGSVVFRVVGDERTLYESPVLRGGDAPLPISADVSGVLLLRLEVLEAENADIADHADWAEARLLK